MPTILNVDDKELNRYIRSQILTGAKYRVVEADGGRRALELCRSLKPELVLLNVNMPDLHGREVCRRIKEECGANTSVMVVHISATATATEDQVRGLEGGADAYLAEPVDAELLLATVRSMLRLHSAERKLKERDAGLRRLVDSNIVGIVIAGMEGIKDANDEYCASSA
jgi:DNA-binding response OmpR family regulator